MADSERNGDNAAPRPATWTWPPSRRALTLLAALRWPSPRVLSTLGPLRAGKSRLGFEGTWVFAPSSAAVPVGRPAAAAACVPEPLRPAAVSAPCPSVHAGPGAPPGGARFRRVPLPGSSAPTRRAARQVPHGRTRPCRTFGVFHSKPTSESA